MRSLGGSIHWKKNLSKMCVSALSKDEKTLEIAEAGPIWTKDPFLHVKKDVRGANCLTSAG